MGNDEQGSDTGRQLRAFFEQLRDQGETPVYRAYIDKLEQEGELGGEAADLLREGNRHAIERHLHAAPSSGGPAQIFIFWPPGAG